ncbi:DoxX family membrane protein [Candidatus Woesearchaeota archaeon]|jgi:uncharacterized membrane protein YphA (DoxX/SURF4 family)|nr:DoxX family membrane protein [Candidatus Woesearchaeota archaeon]MBT4376199.1 DoxX family membrane protein [archaeon]MBT4805735.1 DoxX family membrane protein [Candidatus Woesearchaeota archaeon]MBT5343123.1 DoxX family membrane protein [Candidatus Woesearchaeota archaeon]MBT6774984.1 DoxX family membrane protein [Candidatus Woesearchaeota archaeon]
MANLINPLTTSIIRVILGLLFLISGILKIRKLKDFFFIVVQYGILKGKLARIFAYTLPFAELIIGLFLLINYLPFITAILTLLLLLLSTSGLLYVIYKKKEMDDCGCYGGTVKVPIGLGKITENLIWILLAIYLLISII